VRTVLPILTFLTAFRYSLHAAALAADTATAENPVRIHVDCTRTNHILAGGIGASWHAMGPDVIHYPDLIGRDNRACIERLIKTNGYTCIHWITVNNEPGMGVGWWQGPDTKPDSIMPAIRAMRDELDRRGLNNIALTTYDLAPDADGAISE
jgi:hypothetical protein